MKTPVPALSSRLVWGVILLLLTPGLLGHAPWKPDEPFSFDVIYNFIIQPQHWLVPTLAGEPFMEKPPLYYWSAALLARAFSDWLPLHDGARLASGFYSLLTLGFTWLAARQLWPHPRAAYVTLLLGGTVGYFSNSHHILTDVALFAGVAIALYGLTLTVNQAWKWGGVWLGLGVGIGFMAKGLLAPGLFAIVLCLLPVHPHWRQRAYFSCCIIAFLVSLPWLSLWPAHLWLHSPTLFNIWFWDNNFGRFLGTSHLGPGAEPWFYTRTLPWLGLPAIFLLLQWLPRWRQLWTPQAWVLLSLLGTTLLVLASSHDEMSLYAVPALIPLALLASAHTLSPRLNQGLFFFSSAFFGSFILLLWGAWFALLAGYAPLLTWAAKWVPGYHASWSWVWFIYGAFYSGVWLVLSVRRDALLSWTCGLAAFAALLNGPWIPMMDWKRSYSTPFEVMAQHLPANSCLASIGLGEHQRGSLHSLTRLITQRIENGEGLNCPYVLVQSSDVTVQMHAGWRILWHGSRPDAKKDDQYWLMWRPTHLIQRDASHAPKIGLILQELGLSQVCRR